MSRENKGVPGRRKRERSPCTDAVFYLGEGPGWWRTPSSRAEVLGRSLLQDPEKDEAGGPQAASGSAHV